MKSEHVYIWGRYQCIATDDPKVVVLRDTKTGEERTHREGDPYPGPGEEKS